MGTCRGVRNLFLTISALLALAACNENRTESVFPQQSLTCKSSSVKNQFILHYKNGSRRVVKGLNREQLIKKYVEPQLDSLIRVDADQKLLLPQNQLSGQNSQGGQWGLVESKVEAAWTQGVRGEGVLVAVVDSPVDINHSLLQNQIAYNSGEQGLDSNGKDKTSNGVDDDNNGYIDDWAGYDFTKTPQSDSMTRQHGTHVAGIIAAEHHLNHVDTSEPFNPRPQGVAPSVKILPASFIGSDGGGSVSDALSAMDFAVRRGAKIINASWGGRASCAPSLIEKVQQLSNEGILFVAAAGNNSNDLDKFPEHPATFNLPLQVTVGSIAPLLGMASHSNYSRNLVHLFAPGERILSTYPGEGRQLSTGTSMATPFVTGALALLMSYRPDLPPATLKKALLDGVDTDTTYQNQTSGRLNIEKSLELLRDL